MGRDRAAYMRDYRARRKPEVAPEPADPPIARLLAQIEDLQDALTNAEAEIRRLKTELAKRPFAPGIVDNRGQDQMPLPDLRSFNSRPFTPVPKSGRSPSGTSARGRAG